MVTRNGVAEMRRVMRLQVLVTGQGRNFCAGIDLSMAAGLIAKWPKDGRCPARAAERSRLDILQMQDSLTAFERCRWPVIAAIHGTCPVSQTSPVALSVCSLSTQQTCRPACASSIS